MYSQGRGKGYLKNLSHWYERLANHCCRFPGCRKSSKRTRSIDKSCMLVKWLMSMQEIPIVAKDATFLISLATEEFIRRLTEAGKMVADREKRATVQHKDIGVSSLPTRK